MKSLKGETLVYIQKIIEIEKNFKKIFKELPFINLALLIIFTISIFIISPNLKSASIFFLPFILILLLNSLVLIAYRFKKFKDAQYDLLHRNFMEHSRVITDIANNYKDNLKINSIMEVLTVGCDINDKNDMKKIVVLNKQLTSDWLNNLNLTTN